MRDFFKLLLAFAPWLAFLFIAHGSLFRLKLGLVVALVLTVVMGVLRLHRGVILWVGLAFFAAASVAVLGFDNLWTIQRMGIFASGALAVGAWATILMKQPFTLDYAKEHTAPALWTSPVFIRTNMLLTTLWAGTFTTNALLAWGKMRQVLLSELGYEILSYTLLVGTMFFTTWWPKRLKRLREAREGTAA